MRRSVLGLSLVAACVLAAFAQQSVTKVAWEDLVPKQTPIVNPFEKMKEADLDDLAIVARVHDLKKQGKKPTAKQTADANTATASLKKRGLDAAKLLAERDRVMRQRYEQARAVKKDLNGKTVRIAGYLLPLEIDETKVTEFLLVPWVGACIHTPPPPPNQIVYVKMSKPLNNVDLFIPITVTGKMTVKSLQKELFLVDGSDMIDVGYSMQASNVAVYK